VDLSKRSELKQLFASRRKGQSASKIGTWTAVRTDVCHCISNYCTEFMYVRILALFSTKVTNCGRLVENS
jgi:hypothetical protein